MNLDNKSQKEETLNEIWKNYEVVLITDNSEESRLVIQLLQEKGVLYKEIKNGENGVHVAKADLEAEGKLPWLRSKYNGTFYGYKGVKFYLENFWRTIYEKPPQREKSIPS